MIASFLKSSDKESINPLIFNFFKKGLLFFVILFLFTVFVFPSNAHAAPYAGGESSQSNSIVPGANPWWPNLMTEEELEDLVEAYRKAKEEEEAREAAKSEAEKKYVCLDVGLTGIKEFNFGYCIAWVVAYIGAAILTLVSLIVSLSGAVFDYVLSYTVEKLPENLYSSGLETGINNTWTTLRDLANMFFIFVLLYISITTILGTGDNKRLLKNVIIVALLINFSLFATKAVIEVSNAAAISFYNAIATEDGSISKAFLNEAGVRSNEEKTSHNLMLEADGAITGIMGLIVVKIILFIVLAFILFVTSILFITRYIMFIILMILSPLAFVASILPTTKSEFKKWFESLTHYAIFAPVFLMLMWASLKILNSIGSTPNLDNVITGDGTTIGEPSAAGAAIFTTLIAIGFLIASLVIAQSLSLKGASGAANFGSKWGKIVIGGATAGAAARAGRRSVGMAGQKISESERVKNLKGSNYGVVRGLGNMVQGGGEKMAKSSFDVRATGALSGYGTAKSGGYTGFRSEKQDKIVSQAKKQAPSSAVIEKAERELKEATTEQDRVEKQKRLNELKGINEEEARKRNEEINKRNEEKKRKLREEAEREVKERGYLDTDDLEEIVDERLKEIEKEEGIIYEKVDNKAMESLGEKRTKEYIEKSTRPRWWNKKDGFRKDTWGKYEDSKKKKK